MSRVNDVQGWTLISTDGEFPNPLGAGRGGFGIRGRIGVFHGSATGAEAAPSSVLNSPEVG